MENTKIIDTLPHEMENELLEKLLDYMERRRESSPRDDPHRSRRFMRKGLKIHPHKDKMHIRCYAIRDNMIIGSALAEYTIRENDQNPDQMWTDIFVLPAHRRKGLGSILLNKIIEFGKAEKRLTLMGGIFPIDGEDGPKFLETRGVLPKLNEKVSRLYKDAINWDYVNSSERKLEEKLSQYRIERYNAVEWANRVLSDDIFATELADFMTEADHLIPMEDVEMKDQVTTKGDMRRWADRYLKMSELWDNMIYYLYDKDRVIAMSGTYYPMDPPIRDVGTGFTAVREAYQRKGIATYLKIKILRYYVDNHPDFEYIYTENAASNEGMLSINIALGFKPKYDWKMYQGKFGK